MKLSLSEDFVSNIIVTMVISNKSCCKHVLFTNLSDFISTTTRVTSVKSKKFLFCSFSVAKFGIAPVNGVPCKAWGPLSLRSCLGPLSVLHQHQRQPQQRHNNIITSSISRLHLCKLQSPPWGELNWWPPPPTALQAKVCTVLVLVCVCETGCFTSTYS